MLTWLKRLFRRPPVVADPAPAERLFRPVHKEPAQPQQLYFGTVLSFDDEDTVNVALNDGRVVQADLLEGRCYESLTGAPFFVGLIGGKYYINPPVYRT